MARRGQDPSHHMYKDAPAPEPDWDERRAGASRRAPSPGQGRDIIALPAPASEAPAALERQERPPAEKEAERSPKPDAQGEKSGEKPRKGWLRRHPILTSIGLAALLLAAAAGYFYWDHTAHFESTDDAFVAARQFAIAPKVPGYVTAVPVTDNQHVNRGDVIAQIDQRDYGVALAQAEAQVTGAEAGIRNIDTQIATQEA